VNASEVVADFPEIAREKMRLKCSGVIPIYFLKRLPVYSLGILLSNL
jgi:hypothetical protein